MGKRKSERRHSERELSIEKLFKEVRKLKSQMKRSRRRRHYGKSYTKKKRLYSYIG